ncbi:39S ribosomal protein L20, mitochondrial [Diaphorina citri]|uniref:Large ribosomal subunit protein bL20m n=1 Tax=Diaphorina citri TaxID=121845 RepID=A0A1S4EEE4_DIACI|nr:39S ribosomal protein L20, mitochondrial [Diaphorina citri]
MLFGGREKSSKCQLFLNCFQLWTARITAGAEEHGVPYPLFREGLTRSNIMLDRKTLSDLAAWEPRTFKSLTQIAAAKVIDDEVVGSRHLEQPKYFFRRDLLKKFWNH